MNLIQLIVLTVALGFLGFGLGNLIGKAIGKKRMKNQAIKKDGSKHV